MSEAFICGASRHRPPKCFYEQESRWRGPCPGCGGYWNCILKRELSTAEDANASLSLTEMANVKRVSTGVRGFDHVIGGGIYAGQQILLGGAKGSRKTSYALVLLNSLAERIARPVVFVSAEMGLKDIVSYCRTLNVTSTYLKIWDSVTDVGEIIERCADLRPACLALDSLTAMSNESSNIGSAITKEIMIHCKRSGMMALLLNHMTTELGFKGGTGPGHFVDAVVMFEPFIPKMDGDPIEMFGEDVARDILHYHRKDFTDEILNFRVLAVHEKNRNGPTTNRAYYFTDDATGCLTEFVPFPPDEIAKRRREKKFLPTP